MNYVTTKAIESVLRNYQTNNYRQRYVTTKLLDCTGRFTRRYQRAPAVRTMKVSYFVSRVESELLRRQARKNARANAYLFLIAATQALAGKKRREDADDWARFFYQPVVIYSNRRKEAEAKKSQQTRYELVELKNPGSHREFLIREGVTSRLVEWGDLPDVNAVREYLESHGFPEDQCYSEKQFLDEVENGRGEIFLCVEKRETAEFILNLCNRLIGKST